MFRRSNILISTIQASLLLLWASVALATDDVAEALVEHDYMVAVNRPSNLHFIDLKTEQIVRTCQLPDSVAPGTVVMSPDKLVAYVLGGRFDRIFGVAINNCELLFDASFSHDNVRIKSIASLAVSPDGQEIYTIHNPVRMLNDHYEVLDSRFAVYRAADGVDAKPIRTFPVPRQINIMAAGHDGRVYLSGPDVYVIEPKTGALATAIASRTSNRKGYGIPDILTVWPVGSVSDEFVRMYTVARFTDETANMETAEWLWGFEKVDLATGETEVKDFSALEEVYFTGMHRPGHPDEFYQVLTQLKRNKVSEQRGIKKIDLERTYYCINFSTDGSKIYLGGTYNDIAVYDAETLTKLSNFVLPGGDMSMATPQIFSLPLDKVVYSSL
jgi:quinohemoprotein amine dehydrogenase beta subunit